MEAVKVEHDDLYRWVGGVPNKGKRQLLVEWIREKGDPLLRLLPCTAFHGDHLDGAVTYSESKSLIMSRMLAGRFSVVDTVDYYKHQPPRSHLLTSDIELCLGVCPLFVMHGVARRLQGDADRGHACRETLLLLHVLKHAVLGSGDTDMSLFLRRLFDLIEERVTGPKKSQRASLFSSSHFRQHYLLVMLVFMSDNLDFLLLASRPDRSEEQYYTFAIQDVKQPGVIQRFIENNLLYGVKCESLPGRCRQSLISQMDHYCSKMETRWILFYHESRKKGTKPSNTIKSESLELAMPAVCDDDKAVLPQYGFDHHHHHQALAPYNYRSL
jgi:hypothetical protein